MEETNVRAVRYCLWHNLTMGRLKTQYIKWRWKYRRLRNWYFKKRHAYRRRRRMLFPSPAELRFVEIMGGKVWRLRWLKDPRTHFCLAYVRSLGAVLESENVRREVQVGYCFIDFAVANKYYKRGIEIDGRNFHQDILREQKRDDYVRQYGYNLLHIQAIDLFNQPAVVQRRVLKFLNP